MRAGRLINTTSWRSAVRELVLIVFGWAFNPYTARAGGPRGLGGDGYGSGKGLERTYRPQSPPRISPLNTES